MKRPAGIVGAGKRAIPVDTPDEDRGGRILDLDRRSFLGWAGVGAAVLTVGVTGSGCGDDGEAAELPSDAEQRRQRSKQIRVDSAQLAYDRPLPEHPTNGEEEESPYVASFSKGLPHDEIGEVEPGAYEALRDALRAGTLDAFEAVPLGGTRKLVNPLGGVAFDLVGPDSHSLAIRPAPRLDSPENSAEAAELYWMALCRDVDFRDYGDSAIVSAAAADLSRFSDYRAAKENGRVTPGTIFRGDLPGDMVGPYVSQFLLRDIPYGSLTISQRQTTVQPGVDFVSDYDEWLMIQNGRAPVAREARDPAARYIRNGRDLAAYVHVDVVHEAFFNAALIMLGLAVPASSGNPYRSSTTSVAFVTLGVADVCSLIAEAANRALKAAWFQKWFVHRRLRPEELGGRVHNLLTGVAEYTIDSELLDSPVLEEVFGVYGTYLLPQAYPEGCPLHPALPAGHAAIAAACSTILKAWFDESYVLSNPVVPNAEGTELLPYTGAGADALTVRGEIEKLAANISLGRNFAGIHWHTDYSESLKLGEAIAIGVLEEIKATYPESFQFVFTRYDGTVVRI